MSLSIPEQMIKDMDEVEKALGYTGRSELVRSGIRLLLQDAKEKNALAGKVTAVLVVTHSEEYEDLVTRIGHRYKAILRTHIHNEITKNNCVEFFFLEGEGSEVTALTRDFQREDAVKSVKLVTF